MRSKDPKISDALVHLQAKKQKINVFERLTSFPRNTSKEGKKEENQTKSKNKSKHKIQSQVFEDIKTKMSIYKPNEKEETKLRKKPKIIDRELKRIHSDQRLNAGIHIKMKSEENLEKGKMTNALKNVKSIQDWGSKKNIAVSSEQIEVYMKSFENSSVQKLEGERSFLSSNRETSLVFINENPEFHKSIEKLKKPKQLKLKLIKEKVEEISENKRDEDKHHTSQKNVFESNRTNNSLQIVKEIDVVICAVNPVQESNKLNSEIDMYKSKCKCLETELGETLQKVKEMENKIIQSQIVEKYQDSSDSTINPSYESVKKVTSTYFNEERIEEPLPTSFQSEQWSQQTTNILYSNLSSPNENKSKDTIISYAKVYSTNNSYSNPLAPDIEISRSHFTATPTVAELPVSTPNQEIKETNAFNSGPSRIVIGPGSPKIIRIGFNREHCTKGCSSYCTCFMNST